MEQQTNSSHVPIPISTEEAFDMVVEYMYTDSYQPLISYDNGAKALLHTRLHIITNCIYMEDLKALALSNLRIAFSKRSGIPGRPNQWRSSASSHYKLSLASILDIARLVYDTNFESRSNQT